MLNVLNYNLSLVDRIKLAWIRPLITSITSSHICSSHLVTSPCNFWLTKCYLYATIMTLFRSSSMCIPSSSLASSLIRSWDQGGSNVISTSASLTSSNDLTFSSTSKGSVSATGQLGVVRVIRTLTSYSSLTKTS